MTLSKAFIHESGTDEATANANLEFAGLVPSSTWNPDDQELKCKFYGALLKYLSRDNVGVKQVAEGGYSITYDKDEKKAYLEKLANDSGCQDLIAAYSSFVVKNISNQW